MNKKNFFACALVALCLAAVPWLGVPAFYLSLLYLICHWSILALSWNILSGYSGYFSFGHGAFFGVGVYAAAGLSANLNWPFMATLPAAMALAALLGLLLGAVVFRVRSVRGELFALLTLAVTFVVATIVLNTRIDGGPGISLAGVAMPKLGPDAASSIYLMALAAALLTAFIAWKVHSSKLGLGLFAIHDDEDVAEVMGVPTLRYKLVALALSCGLAGLAGAIHAMFVNYVTVGETFNITVPLTVVLMSVLGGSRYWAGPIVGAVVITLLLYAFTAGNSAVLGRAAFGAVLVAVILFMPNGILERLDRWRKERSKGANRTEPEAEHKTEPRVEQSAKDGAVNSGALTAERASVAVSASESPVNSVNVSAVSSTSVSAANLASAAKSDLAHLATRPRIDRSKPLLDARQVSKSFAGVQALDGVDLKVYPGEILGLLGPNGSGKSTFINLVSGHFPATSGQILFEGKDLTQLKPHAIAQAGVARTYQIPRPFAHMSVLQNVALVAMFGAASPTQFQATQEAWRWLEFTDLADKAHDLPDALNLHQRKFLELARALAARPKLVLLDEVLSGLTPSEINDAVALIQKIRAQGSTIVFVEHVMHAVMALVDRIAVLNQGRLLAEGEPQAVMSNPAVVKAYLGNAVFDDAGSGGAEFGDAIPANANPRNAGIGASNA
jgi:branched-chain amino acid transport system permease protein